MPVGKWAGDLNVSPKNNKCSVNIQNIHHLNHRGNGIKYNLKFQSNHCHNGYNEESK